MNSKFKFIALLASFTLTATLCACMPESGNDGADGTDKLPPSVITPSGLQSKLAGQAETIIKDAPEGLTTIPDNATKITGKITIDTAGSYFVNSEISGKKITVDCKGVTLYLSNAKLSNEKKVIESSYPLTITLLGENTVSNSNEAGSNAIDCTGDLVINGKGSLRITSTKNGIKANSLSVIGASLDIASENDGLHAEVEKYDTATSSPSPSYDDGGYVYLNGADVKVNSGADGIQADTFVYVTDSTVNITANGGTPSGSSSNLSGKGIKAGPIDWGANKTDLDWTDELVHIKDSTIDIDANDDAIHSDGEANIESGSVTLATGDDAIHADYTLNVGGGKINITKSHEGLESSKINILGGEISLIANDDGINAGGGADNSGFGGNDGGGGWGPWRPKASAPAPSDNAVSKASINISGGKVYVNSTGDGLDSNGDIIVTGGELYVDGPVSAMDAPIDCDGSARITGGIVVAAGSKGMAQNFGSTSTQGSILYNLSSAGIGKVALADANGEIISFTPSKNYTSVLVSCPEIVKGGKYTLTAGGKSVDITITNLICSNGSSMGGR